MDLTQKQLDEIDWNALTKKIENTIKVPVELHIKLKNGKIDIISNDIIDKSGVMSSVFKELYIINFGSRVDENELEIEINFRWIFKSGGQNGSRLFSVSYNFNEKTWKFFKV